MLSPRDGKALITFKGFLDAAMYLSTGMFEKTGVMMDRSP